ncbi:MAG: methyltransferase domain-containing protein [Candidatus Binatia bacterium]|nr:methyltransferase domain-containing protein [Candidatus Binatia bacterium]
MPFPVYVPFFPNAEPHRLLSREATPESEASYLEEAHHMVSAATFAAALPRHGLVLDAGCGGGRWTHFALACGCRVVAVDWHRPVLHAVRSRAPQALLVAADAGRLPFRDGVLAGAISLGVVEHDPAGPAAMLHELARVLEPGGTLLLSVPYNNWLRRTVFNRLYRRYNNRWAGRGHYFVEYRFGARELRRFLAEQGLTVERFVPHEFFPPRNMGWVADHNMLSIRFVPKGQGDWDLALPSHRGWTVERRWQPLLRTLWRISPWIVAGEILAVAHKRR